MKRRLFNLLAGLSLLLCMATMAIWIRSVWASDWVSYDHRPYHLLYSIQQGEGGLRVAELPLSPDLAASLADSNQLEYRHGAPFDFGMDDWAPVSVPWWQRIRAPMPTFWNAIVTTPEGGTLGTDREIIIPDWLIILLTLPLPAIQLLRWRRSRRRQRIGQCPTCNYDLRATPNRCPECGTVPKTILIPK